MDRGRKDVWAIARVERNPFGLKEKGNAIKEQGVLLDEDDNLKEASQPKDGRRGGRGKGRDKNTE